MKKLDVNRPNSNSCRQKSRAITSLENAFFRVQVSPPEPTPSTQTREISRVFSFFDSSLP